MSNAAKMVEMIVRELVDSPDGVTVRQVKSGHVCVLEVQAPGEAGKIIGRGGRIAETIRTLLSCVGSKEKIRYLLNVIE